MFPKIVLFGKESRSKMLEGINILANSVKSTLGPQGRNVVVGVKNNKVRFTKDGVSVAKEVCLEDAVLDTGVNIIREVALNTVSTVGDGTTTSTVIAQNIINQGVSYIEDGYNPMDLKRGIDIAIKAVEKYLRENSIDISTDEELINIATIACNGDRELGELIADTFKKVGKEGVITLYESSSGKTEVTMTEGLELDKGFISEHFVTNYSKMVCELNDPYILVYDKKISTLTPLLPLLQSIKEPVLIIAEDVDSEALATLVVNFTRRNSNIVAIRSPFSYSALKRMDIISDLSVMTGLKMSSEDMGIKLEGIRKDMLGRAKKIIIGADKTTIIGGNGNQQEIQERCDYLRSEIESTDNPDMKDYLKKRLAAFTTGVAIIKVGGISDFDIKELKDRVEDAVHATRAALQEGILPGGGIALLNASEHLASMEMNQNQDIDGGIFLVQTALKAPFNQILENAGLIPEEILEGIDRNSPDAFRLGYDALNCKHVNMVEAGIIDPTKVVVTAFKDAASIAGLMLTTEVALIEENEIILNTVNGSSNSIKVRV